MPTLYIPCGHNCAQAHRRAILCRSAVRHNRPRPVRDTGRAMSQENVEIVQAAFRAFENGDMAGVLRLCDENIEITQAVELPGVSRQQHGHGGVLEAFAIWPDLWDDYRIEIVRLADFGDYVMVTTVNRGRGKESGVPVEMPFTFL